MVYNREGKGRGGIKEGSVLVRKCKRFNTTVLDQEIVSIEKTGSGFPGEFGRLKKSRTDFNGTLEATRNLLKTTNSQGELTESDVWGFKVIEKVYHEALRSGLSNFVEFPHRDRHKESYGLYVPGTRTTLLSMFGRIVMTKIIIKHLEMLHASNGTTLTKNYAKKEVQERAVFSYEQPFDDLDRLLEYHETTHGETISSVKLVDGVISNKRCGCCQLNHNTPKWTWMDQDG